MLNYNFLVLGFVIVGLLFAPTAIPYMVPIAEAAPMDNPADAINDLSLTSISKYGNQADRNSITLSWSAPNDNGSPILFYNIQVHEISGNGWTVLENDVYGTTYTHENAPTPYQFSYRVFAIAADGCNGSSSTFYNACNEGNILHVVSLPNAESGPNNSSCNNSDLDDCGYFDTEKIDTCFNRSGYSIPGVVDVTDGGNEFVFVGKLSPKENGQCMTLNDDYFLPNKSVTILAEKGTQIGAGNEQKSVTVVTNSDGSEKYGFVVNFPFTDASDVGQWRILFDFAGDSEHNPTEDNFSPQMTITVTETATETATGPFTITDDSTGGDCTSIGTWSSASKTCTLTGDITVGQVHAIVVGSDGITIDGAGHSISGGVLDESCPMSGVGTCSTMAPWNGNAGVYMFNKDHVVIKNLIINGFFHGILTDETSSYGIITGNTISSPGQYPHGSAIDIKGGNYVQITNNEISNSYKGIKVFNVRGTDQCSGNNSFVISQNTINMPSDSEFGISNTYNSINENGKGVCIDQNTITGGGTGIINWYSQGGIITNNIVTGADIGFSISSAVTSFTGNTLSGNGVNFDGISQESSTTDDSAATGPFTITDDSTGGDCNTIGTWSSASKTCTLNTDVTATGNNNGISVASNDIILDGAGHTVSSSIEGGLGGNFGVYVDNQLTGFVVKNFNIQGFHSGIKAYNTEGGIITANTVSSPNHIAIEAYSARALQITDNNISNSQIGIENVES